MSEKNPFEGGLSEGIHQMFLAGVGAMALTGEKGKEFFDQLVSSGEEAVKSGKEFNRELKHDADKGISEFKKDSLYELLIRLSPQERDELLKRVNEYKDGAVKIDIDENNQELKRNDSEVESKNTSEA